jgi:hypothetical protein
METYSILKNQVYSEGIYCIVPIRHQDRFDIMNWRNEQLYHLRQEKPLSVEDQNQYFNNVINKLFEVEKPNQLLFSYLENGVCIGYGGLVHVNWIDKNAEISFIMATELEEVYFNKHWVNFLNLIEQVAFKEIGLHKIYTYAFDLRPSLYLALQEAKYDEVVKLKEHCFSNGKYIDVLIHSKIQTC